MKPERWLLLLAIAAAATACDDENAIYRSSKYVPGYTPRGDSGPAIAQAKVPDRRADWRAQ